MRLVLGSLKNRFYLPGDAWVLAVSATVWTVGSAMANPYQSVFFSAVGANSLVIGYLLAVSSAVSALMQLVGGYVADAWGRRKVILAFSFISACSAFVFIFIGQASLLIVPIIVSSIAGIYGPAFNAMLTESMEPTLRARGVVSFTLISSLPSVFSPYVGGLLMQSYGALIGLRFAFFMSGLFGVIGVSYRAFRLKETYAGDQANQKKTLRHFISDFFSDTRYALENATDGAKKLLAYSILASAGTSMTVPYTALYLVDEVHLQPQLYGILTNFAGLISVLLLLPAARILERVGLRKSAIYASVSVPVSQLIFVRARGMDDLVAWTSLGGASGAFLGPSLTTLQADLSSQEVRGRIMALFSMLSLVTSVPAQILGGYLYGNWGPLVPFSASIPVFVLATFTLTRVKEKDSYNRSSKD